MARPRFSSPQHGDKLWGPWVNMYFYLTLSNMKIIKSNNSLKIIGPVYKKKRYACQLLKSPRHAS
jgi:hypothetical protein